MDHPLHSNGQVSTTHREPRRPYSPSQTELSSPETCCDSYSGGTMSFQRLRYTSPWGIETTPSSYAISPSQTPTELMMEDPFASFCNNQPDMPPSLMTPCSSSKELSEWVCKIAILSFSFESEAEPSVRWISSTAVWDPCDRFLYCESGPTVTGLFVILFFLSVSAVWEYRFVSFEPNPNAWSRWSSSGLGVRRGFKCGPPVLSAYLPGP